jgi:hypothetical protein
MLLVLLAATRTVAGRIGLDVSHAGARRGGQGLATGDGALLPGDASTRPNERVLAGAGGDVARVQRGLSCHDAVSAGDSRRETYPGGVTTQRARIKRFPEKNT